MLMIYGFNFSSDSNENQQHKKKKSKWANQNTNLSQILSSTTYKMPLYLTFLVSQQKKSKALFVSIQ